MNAFYDVFFHDESSATSHIPENTLHSTQLYKYPHGPVIEDENFVAIINKKKKKKKKTKPDHRNITIQN